MLKEVSKQLAFALVWDKSSLEMAKALSLGVLAVMFSQKFPYQRNVQQDRNMFLIRTILISFNIFIEAHRECVCFL